MQLSSGSSRSPHSWDEVLHLEWFLWTREVSFSGQRIPCALDFLEKQLFSCIGCEGKEPLPQAGHPVPLNGI